MKELCFEGKKRMPSKIVCVGRNYVEHIEELGNEMPDQMVLFFKPNSAISEELDSVHQNEVLHYESEIAFGIRAGRIGYVGFAFDLTKRELQSTLRDKGLPWERSKAFDGSAVFSPLVAFEGEFDGLKLELWVDGVLVQKGGVLQMINKPLSILAELRGLATFEDYDIILSGTPKGVGELVVGSQYIGIVKNGDDELVRCTWYAR